MTKVRRRKLLAGERIGDRETETKVVPGNDRHEQTVLETCNDLLGLNTFWWRSTSFDGK